MVYIQLTPFVGGVAHSKSEKISENICVQEQKGKSFLVVETIFDIC